MNVRHLSEVTDVRYFRIGLSTRFRGLTEREGALLRGPQGWGEFSPFLEYEDPVARPWLDCALEAAVLGWPKPQRAQVPVNVTVPACSPEDARRIVASRAGATTAKVKVAEPGQSLAEDQERLETVRDEMGSNALIRIDVNGAWTFERALAELPVLERAASGLEYVEQPCVSVEDLARLRRRTQVPIAADESIRRAEDPYRVRDLEAADVAVLKVQPLGGVRRCLEIAEDIQMPVVVSSAVESSVGLAAGVALAASLPELPHACGLATAQLLRGDVTDDSLLPVAGAIAVRGVEVDPECAEIHQHPQPDEWEARLARVASLGEDQRHG